MISLASEVKPKPSRLVPPKSARPSGLRGRAALAAALGFLSLCPAACVRACGGAPPLPEPVHLAVEIAAGLPCTESFAVSDTQVWLANYPAVGAAELQALPKAGGSPRTVVTLADTLLGRVAVHRGFVYFAYQPLATAPTAPPAGLIARIAESGGAVETLAPHETPIVDLAVADDGVFWLTRDEVRHMPLGGGAIDTLASGQHSAEALALDGGEVYWITNSRYDLSALELALKRVPRAGGAVQVVTTWANASLLDLAVSGGEAWVLTDEGHAHTPGTRAIDYVARSGGAPARVVMRESESRMVSDARGIYWSEARSTGLFSAQEGLWDMGAGPAKPALSALFSGSVAGLAMDSTHVFALITAGGSCSLQRVER